MSGPRRLPQRSRSGRQLAGVCSGLAEAYGADVRLIRLVFVAAGFVNGLGLVGYLLLWALMPRSPGDLERDPSGGVADDE